MTKTNVKDVASFFIALAQDAGEQLTHMKLQKLLYYAQAWYLGMYNEPLFDSTIEAWKHGPVCPEIYHEFKRYGNQNISFMHDCEDVEGCLPIAEKNLTPDTVYFLQTIADDYMKYSAFELSSKTHQERPWIDAMFGREEITKSAMQSYYGELVLDETEVCEIEEGQRAIQDGKGVEWKPGMFA